MKRNDYKRIGSRTIDGKRVTVSEHKDLAYWRLGQCNIPAKTLDEAIEKFKKCKRGN